jgi:hypothetical protein
LGPEAILAFLPELIKGLPWVLCAVLFGLWQWDRADLAEAKTAQETAINSAQAKADALAAKLTDAEAKAAAVTQQKVIQFVDRIQASPDDVSRNIAGSLGVRAIIGGSGPQSPSGSPAGVPGPAASPGPK